MFNCIKGGFEYISSRLSETVYCHPYSLINVGVSTFGFACMGSIFTLKLFPAKIKDPETTGLNLSRNSPAQILEVPHHLMGAGILSQIANIHGA